MILSMSVSAAFAPEKPAAGSRPGSYRIVTVVPINCTRLFTRGDMTLNGPSKSV
jgi:hypothetical protein